MKGIHGQGISSSVKKDERLVESQSGDLKVLIATSRQHIRSDLALGGSFL